MLGAGDASGVPRPKHLLPLHPNPMRNRPLSAVLLLSACLAGCTRPAMTSPAPQAQVQASAAAPQIQPFDQWFVDAANGQKTGWSRRSLAQNDKGQWLSTERSSSVEKHGDEKVEATGLKETLEAANHQLISITSTSTQSSAKNTQTIRQVWLFTPKGVELTSDQGGSVVKRLLPPVKGTWLAPALAAATHRAHHLAGDKTFDIPSLDLGLGSAPFMAHYERIGEENLKLPIGPVKTVKYKMTYSNLPGVVSYEWYDADGKFVNNSYTMSGMEFTNQAATAELAQATFVPTEMTGVSVVSVDRPIPTPALLQKAVYELVYSPECPLLPATVADQKVEKLGPGRARVTVELGANNPSPPPTADDLGTSIQVDWKDPSVLALLPQIFDRFGDEKLSDEKRANETTRFVSRYMADGACLAVANGTASATAKSKMGDCTEHATLLTALLRAQGIPARGATGMAYADEEGFVGHQNAFIFHMWTQAWLKDDNGKARWVNLDAALRRYDAVHILLGTSSLDDATGADEEAKVMPLMESLKVKLIETAK